MKTQSQPFTLKKINRCLIFARPSTWLPKLLMGAILLFIVLGNASTSANQHFSELAYSFIHGKLYFETLKEGVYDLVEYQGHCYWPLGPFPSILLIPLIVSNRLFSHDYVYQSYAQIIIVAGTIWLLYQLIRHYCRNSVDRHYWLLAFVAGSSYFAVAVYPIYAHYAHVVTVFFILLLLYQLFVRSQYRFTGYIVAAIVMTRLSAGIGALALLLLHWHYYGDTQKTSRLFMYHIVSPLIGSILLLAWYNYARFGNPLETGYSLQNLLYEPLHKAREYGLFSLHHIPGNLYYLFLASPLPVYADSLSQVLQFPYIRNNPWGTSLFLVSPYLVNIFFVNYTRTLRILLIACAVAALPIVTYYGIGYRQFGNRYALDFFPYLFLIVLVGYYQKNDRLSVTMKCIIIFSVVINFWLIASL